MLKIDADKMKKYKHLQTKYAEDLTLYMMLENREKQMETVRKVVAANMCMEVDDPLFEYLEQQSKTYIEQYLDDRKTMPTTLDYSFDDHYFLMVSTALVKEYSENLNEYISPEAFLLSPYVDNILTYANFYSASEFEDLFQYPTGPLAMSNGFGSIRARENIRMIYLLSVDSVNTFTYDVLDLVKNNDARLFTQRILQFKENYSNAHKLFIDVVRHMAKQEEHLERMYGVPYQELDLVTLKWLIRYESLLINQTIINHIYHKHQEEILQILNGDDPKVNFRIFLDDFLYENMIKDNVYNVSPVDQSMVLTKMITDRMTEERDILIPKPKQLWKTLERNMYNGIDMVMDTELLHQTIENFHKIRAPLYSEDAVYNPKHRNNKGEENEHEQS